MAMPEDVLKNDLPRRKDNVPLVLSNDPNAVVAINEALFNGNICVIMAGGSEEERDSIRDGLYEVAESAVGYDWPGKVKTHYSDLGDSLELTLSLIKKD